MNIDEGQCCTFAKVLNNGKIEHSVILIPSTVTFNIATSTNTIPPARILTYPALMSCEGLFAQRIIRKATTRLGVFFSKDNDRISMNKIEHQNEHLTGTDVCFVGKTMSHETLSSPFLFRVFLSPHTISSKIGKNTANIGNSHFSTNSPV